MYEVMRDESIGDVISLLWFETPFHSKRTTYSLYPNGACFFFFFADYRVEAS